jgi:hypothetical protein
MTLAWNMRWWPAVNYAATTLSITGVILSQVCQNCGRRGFQDESQKQFFTIC